MKTPCLVVFGSLFVAACAAPEAPEAIQLPVADHRVAIQPQAPLALSGYTNRAARSPEDWRILNSGQFPIVEPLQ